MGSYREIQKTDNVFPKRYDSDHRPNSAWDPPYECLLLQAVPLSQCWEKGVKHNETCSWILLVPRETCWDLVTDTVRATIKFRLWFFFFFFPESAHHVAQSGLKLLDASEPPASAACPRSRSCRHRPPCLLLVTISFKNTIVVSWLRKRMSGRDACYSIKMTGYKIYNLLSNGTPTKYLQR